MVISGEMVQREALSQSEADQLNMWVHLGVLPCMMGMGALLMHCRVPASTFDEIRGKFKKHRQSMKAFTKEKQAQMERDHIALMETNKEMQRIWEMTELEASGKRSGTMAVDRSKSLRKMRTQSIRKLRKQSTRNAMLTSTLALSEHDMFADKFVPIQSSGDMIASRVTVLTK